MLSFLFDGDKRRIDLVNILVEKLKGSDKFELNFLDILDSNPIPETQNPDDYVRWSERLTRLLDTCKETLIGPVFACFMRIIRHLSVIYKTRACFPHSRHAAGSSDSFHTLWRKVLEDLLEILCPVFSETITQHYGNLALSTSYQRCQNLKDRIRFVKHYEAGQRYIRKKKIGRSHNDHQVATTDLVRAYSVIVEPDLIIKSMIKPKDGRFAEISALTIEIGPQCVNPNMLFVATSDSETSSSSVYTANAKEEDEAYEMEDVLDSAGSTKKPKPAKAAPTDEFQLVGTKVRSQHLLEMISSARANLASIDNNEWIKRVDIKGSSLKTAGMLWFHNAVFLTKLDAKISHLDGNEHQGSQSGKYILYEKYFNPLNGHWKLLAFYWLATSLSAHILEDPNNPNCTSS